MDDLHRARNIAQIEGMEKLYRSWGAFELAVQCQRSVDHLASGGLVGEDICTWFDRGIDRRPYFHERDHMVWVQLPNTMFLVMPKDVQFELWHVLTDTLGMTPQDLFDIALSWQMEIDATESQQGESP